MNPLYIVLLLIIVFLALCLIWRRNLRQAFASMSGQIKTDWRVQFVLMLAFFAGVCTFWIYCVSDTARSPDNLWGAVFAGWIAGFLLFVLGLATAFVSLSRPELDFFESRARALLRGQKGDHIDYILKQMKKIVEPYVEKSTKKITINEFDKDDGKLRITYSSYTIFKGFIYDIETEFDPEIEYKNGSSAPAGKSGSMLNFVKIDGETKASAKPFDTSFKEGPFPTKIPPNQQSTIEHRFSCWVHFSDEANRHSAKRYVRELEVTVENNLSDNSIVVDVELRDGHKQKIVVESGDSAVIVNLKEIEPGEHVYDFRVTPA